MKKEMKGEVEVLVILLSFYCQISLDLVKLNVGTPLLAYRTHSAIYLSQFSYKQLHRSKYSCYNVFSKKGEIRMKERNARKNMREKEFATFQNKKNKFTAKNCR